MSDDITPEDRKLIEATRPPAVMSAARVEAMLRWERRNRAPSQAPAAGVAAPVVDLASRKRRK